jgi:hypothetical protein
MNPGRDNQRVTPARLTNTMKTKIGTWLFVAVSGLLLSGCIGPLFSHDTTVYRDVERTKVEFESDAAARLFYETLSKNPKDQKHSESSTHVNIPILYSQSRKVVPGRNAEFNEAVDACDLNKDGKITELEAKIFANHH